MKKITDISITKVIEMDFVAQQFKINDVLGWNDRKELILSPKFQRRAVWKPKGKSFLIDSIIKGFPLPPFFVRERLSLNDRRTIREVIDGQQRIRTILEFINGQFTVQKIHNELFARTRFVDLPDDVQTRFLSYVLNINVVGQITDREVFEMFSRLNSYSVPLNNPEKANALYTGVFKRFIDDLAQQYYRFWIDQKIFTDASISRMLEIQLTAELIAVMLKGLTDGKSAIYKKNENLYKTYDDSFDISETLRERFEEIIHYITLIFGEDLKETEFSRPPIFFSLFAALYDILFGLPPIRHDIDDNFYKPLINDYYIETVKNELMELNDALLTVEKKFELVDDSEEEEQDNILEQNESQSEVPVRYRDFIFASGSSTDKLHQRTTRHDVLKPLLQTMFENDTPSQ